MLPPRGYYEQWCCLDIPVPGSVWTQVPFSWVSCHLSVRLVIKVIHLQFFLHIRLYPPNLLFNLTLESFNLLKKKILGHAARYVGFTSPTRG